MENISDFLGNNYTPRMSQKTLQKILQTFLSALHILLIVLMVGIGLLALFQPEVIQGVIDWLEMQIKSWGEWNYVILFWDIFCNTRRLGRR